MLAPTAIGFHIREEVVRLLVGRAPPDGRRTLPLTTSVNRAVTDRARFLTIVVQACLPLETHPAVVALALDEVATTADTLEREIFGADRR